MATNRHRRTRKFKRQTISESQKHYFLTGEYGADICPDCPCRAITFLLAGPGNRDELKRAWKAHRVEVLPNFIRENPCTRPWIWWAISAPKEPVPGCAYKFAQRLRLGGIGNLDFEFLANVPRFSYGIPTGWISKFQVEYYNGRSLDVHGKLIESNYKNGDFEGVPIDPENPPVFESEAAYLDRHGLLSKAEKKYLKQHPELLEPEKVEFEED